MQDNNRLAERFEEHRPRLRSIAYRMLGSVTEADDAVQDVWLQLARQESDVIDNMAGWLTTVVARECLHMLRSRSRRREEPFDDRLPDPLVAADDDPTADPEQETLLSDSVGMALMIVLDALTPAERVAFVLHDMFRLPFDEIARLVDRSPAATRQLASRARRRVRAVDDGRAPEEDLARQREVVDAFFAAAREGDLDGLVEVLDPDVVVRTDLGPGKRVREHRGVPEVVKLAKVPRGGELHPVLVNGQIGKLATKDGKPFSIIAFTIGDGRIVEIDSIRDPERVQRLAAGMLPGQE